MKEGFLPDIKAFSLASLFDVSSAVDLIIMKAQSGILQMWADTLKPLNAEAFHRMCGMFPKEVRIAHDDVRPATGDVVNFLSRRFEIPVDSNHVIDREQSDMGLSHQVVLDLQKLFSMICVHLRDQDPTKPDYFIRNIDRLWMKTIGMTVGYSSRLTLAVRQGTLLRNLPRASCF